MTFDDLRQRLQAFPRAIRWAIYAGVFFVLFEAWHATIGVVVSDWSSEADSIEAQVRTVRAASSLTDEIDELDEAIVSLGLVENPSTDDRARLELSDAVTEVLSHYRVRDPFHDLKSSQGRINKTVAALVTAERRDGKKLVRLSYELRFNAEVDEAISIIADLERHPAIEAVSEVRMVKSIAPRVDVNLTIESWALSSGT